MTPELQRLREVAERLRERARQLPAGAAIEPDPSPTPCPASDRAAPTKPEPSAPLPKHWSEVDEQDEEPEVEI